jgi:predicted ATPase
MGLIIKATETKSITIQGTELTLSEIYARIRFVGDFTGSLIEGEVQTFTSKLTYAENKPIFTDVPIGGYRAELQIDEQQTLETAHKYAKLAYEQLGYEVIIDLI